jgi:hypothetical protein
VLAKKSFLKMLIALASVFMILIVAMAVYKLNDIKSSTIRSILNNSLKNLETEMAITLQNTHSQIKIVQEWGNNGLIKLDNEKNILIQFSPLIEQFNIIRIIYIVSDDGKAYAIKKSGNWELYKFLPNKKAILTVYNKDKKEILKKKINIEKDFRNSNWYKSANKSTYGFFYEDVQDKNNVGTISIKWEDKDNKQSGVIAFELSVEFINNIYEKLGNDLGYAFLFDKKGRILNLVDKRVKEIEAKVLETWRETPNKKFHIFSLKLDKMRWWVGVKELKKSKGLMLTIVIPEKEIIPNISKQKNKWYATFAIIVIILIILIHLLLKAYSQSLDKISELEKDDLDESTKLLNLIKNGESSNLEFKSTVRMNLKSGKSGKEIEKAWLKNVVAFLNTDGGIVLLGVTDDGEIFGLEADNFKNKDSCMLHITNLIKQHIGLEFNNYIHIESISVSGKDVVKIEVNKAPYPAYLHMNDKEEEFYIRSGPSTVSLRISKAVKYIIENKKIREKS